LSDSETHRAITAIFRSESARLVAGLTRMLRDVGLAEELAEDAFLAALETWPASGVPDNPGAWLRTTAKNRALNALRRGKMLDEKHRELARSLESSAPESEIDGVDDDVLRLMFTACHPVLPTEARVALTLRLLGGLTSAEIARAFLVAEPTIQQRIVRAKRTLAEKQIPFEVPSGAELGPRLASVLEVVYLIFNEGYSEPLRPELSQEAIRLGRVLAELAPAEPEVHGLSALMQVNASRSTARIGPEGEAVLLLDQGRTLWDADLVARGLASLARGLALAGTRGPYLLQAEITACHARATRAADTDWSRIVSLYDELLALHPSPVIALKRAIAVSMSDGPAAALTILDSLAAEPALASYPFLPAARAELLEKLGRSGEAKREFERAAALAPSDRQRSRLLQRASALKP
jgi:RNA polymerase sigma factor (sigma-70 family)